MATRPGSVARQWTDSPPGRPLIDESAETGTALDAIPRFSSTVDAKATTAELAPVAAARRLRQAPGARPAPVVRRPSPRRRSRTRPGGRFDVVIILAVVLLACGVAMLVLRSPAAASTANELTPVSGSTWVDARGIGRPG